MANHQLMTTEEYLRTPETLAPTELVYGALRVADSPMPRHQAAVLDLGIAISAHVRDRLLGELWLAPLDVILDATRALIVQPDLFYISNERSHILSDRVRGAPDLVVEVLSPFPRIGRVDERIAWFAQYDVRECWLVHQMERRIEVLGFQGGSIAERASFDERTPLRSRVLPEFTRSPGSILRWA